MTSFLHYQPLSAKVQTHSQPAKCEPLSAGHNKPSGKHSPRSHGLPQAEVAPGVIPARTMWAQQPQPLAQGKHPPLWKAAAEHSPGSSSLNHWSVTWCRHHQTACSAAVRGSPACQAGDVKKDINRVIKSFL